MKNIIMGILGVLVILLGGYLGYDKFIKKDPVLNTECIKEDCICENSSLEQISAMSNGMLSTNSAFLIYNQNSIFIQFFEEVEDPKNLLGSKSNYDTGMRVSEDGSTIIEGYKLDAKDVRGIYSFPIGQGELESLVIIYKNGTVDIITIDVGTNILIKSYEENYNGITNAVAAYKKDSIDAHDFDFIYMNE